LDHRAADELIFDEPCVVFALAREASAFLRDFPSQQRLSDAPCWASYCGPSWLNALVLITGMGQANVERALTWLDRAPKLGGVACKPRMLLSAGFAGGLDDKLRVGDLVVATDVADDQGAILPAHWPGELGGAWSPFPHRGRILTVGNAVGEASAKQELASRFGSLAVDMESAIVARWCQRRGLPFGSIRVISDDASTSFSPQMQRLLSDANTSVLRFAGAGLRSPALMMEMIRLARRTKLAGKQLGKALGELLTLTLPFGADL
jgi:nucleoside phosphorylase